MIHDIVIRPEAESELGEAYEWYERHRPGLGDDFLLSTEATLSAVRENPAAFPVVHENIRRALIRRFPYGVFYTLADATVTVLAIFHAQRDPKRWKSRS